MDREFRERRLNGRLNVALDDCSWPASARPMRSTPPTLPAPLEGAGGIFSDRSGCSHVRVFALPRRVKGVTSTRLPASGRCRIHGSSPIPTRARSWIARQAFSLPPRPLQLRRLHQHPIDQPEPCAPWKGRGGRSLTLSSSFPLQTACQTSSLAARPAPAAVPRCPPVAYHSLAGNRPSNSSSSRSNTRPLNRS